MPMMNFGDVVKYTSSNYDKQDVINVHVISLQQTTHKITISNFCNQEIIYKPHQVGIKLSGLTVVKRRYTFFTI